METFSALLAICAGNSPVPGEFPAQRPVARSFDVFFDLRPNKRLSKQWWGWWFETLSCSLWRHRNEINENRTIFTKQQFILLTYEIHVCPPKLQCKILYGGGIWFIAPTYEIGIYVFVDQNNNV